MNTHRFGWPVIIAAGLHGALFLFNPETPARGDPPPRTPAAAPIDLTGARIEIEPEPAEAGGGPSAVTRCALTPISVDVPRVLRAHEPFAVPVESYRGSPHRVSMLPRGIGTPPGLDGDGPGGWSLPDAGRLDRVPRATVQPAPAYPATARREGVGGTVWIEFVVGPSGEVLRADAVRWTQRDFVDPAVCAVLRWRFEPGTIAGRRVSFRMAVPIEFNATQ
jgi:protein TonB